MRQTGILRTWNDDKGFGFIAPAHGGDELFVHITAFPRDGSRPTIGETLSYESGAVPRGSQRSQQRSALRDRVRSSHVRPGTPKFGTLKQDHVPDALYTYHVNGQPYQGREISVWKMSASGLLRNTARILPRQVQPDALGKVPVYYNPKRPYKSLLLRPGWLSILFVWVSLAATVGPYLWRW